MPEAMSPSMPDAPRAGGVPPEPPPAAPQDAPKKPAKAPASGPQRAMVRLGLVRDIDLALHLPIRYDDETRLVAIADARDGRTVQVEGTVTDSRVEQRPRRQLVVRLGDGSGELTLRFLHFYPSQQKALAVGMRIRVRG